LPEWLVERGIGETRAALVEDGRIIEARIELDGTVPAGTILEARLVDKGAGGLGAVARVEGGAEYLLGQVPGGVTQGAVLNIEVTRPAIPGPEPWKRPLARATGEEPRRSGSRAERFGSFPVKELAVPAAADELGEYGWEDVIDEARTGRVDFPGGSLGIFFPPAMTLIDVDGSMSVEQLAIAGARACAETVRRLDIGGSIGIDLPTVKGKEARAAAAQAVDEVLPQPFERTAVNGFGFLQIVRPRKRASLIELAQDRASFEARALVRRAAFEGAGTKRLVAHPTVVAVLEGNRDWVEALARQAGGKVTLRTDASIPIHGSYVEKG
jgi:ribonuclease G